jgi:allantoinase
MIGEPETWPGGKRVAFIVSVMLETWSEGVAPPYSVQATAVKSGAVDYGGIAWGEYGGKIGVWNILRAFEDFKIKGSFCPNARSAEFYPDAIRAIVKAGHGLAGHGVTQDQLLTYLTPQEQLSTIETSIGTLERIAGVRPEGWVSPVLAWTPLTIDMLVQQNLLWYGDPTYIDVPQIMRSASGAIVGIPASDFSDNRVLRASPRHFLDVYKNTFDHLNSLGSMSLLHMTLHCHWGGRPLMMAMVYELLRYLVSTGDVWFTSHSEIAKLINNRSAPLRSISSATSGA